MLAMVGMSGDVRVGVNIVVSYICRLIIYLTIYRNHHTSASNLSKTYRNLHRTSVLGHPITSRQFSPLEMNGVGVRVLFLRYGGRENTLIDTHSKHEH